MRKVILVPIEGLEKEMPFTHINEELPNTIQLFSMLEVPIKVRYYQRLYVFKNGLPVYQEIGHKPSEPFKQP